jgi:drug/metabolite transporter (DMT)-like permease
MLSGAFCLAAMGALTSLLSARCDWLVIALWRAGFMFASAVLLARARGIRLTLSDPPTLWVRSLAGSFSLVCNFYAMTRLPIADALTLASTYPLWILVMSSLFLGLAPTMAEVVGIACGVVGVWLIQDPELAGNHLAIGVALTGAVSTSVAMLGLHRLKGVGTPAVVAHFAGVATTVALVWLLIRGPSALAGRWDGTTFALLMGVAVAGTVGQMCLTKAYASGLPTRLAGISLSQVAFGLAFDLLAGNRTLTLMALAGFALVVTPTAYLSGRAGARLGAASRRIAEPPPISAPG